MRWNTQQVTLRAVATDSEAGGAATRARLAFQSSSMASEAQDEEIEVLGCIFVDDEMTIEKGDGGVKLQFRIKPDVDDAEEDGRTILMDMQWGAGARSPVAGCRRRRCIVSQRRICVLFG